MDDRNLKAGIAHSVVAVVGISAVLAGCAILAKEPVPIGEPPSIAEQPPIGERSSGDSSRGETVAALARRHVGAPYRWGGSSPSGFDCSGLVRYVYAQVGVSLPHNAAKQYQLGTPVPRDSLEPGDLVFFDRLRHNGIYIGDGRFIHARQPGRGVNIARLDDAWYASHWVGGRRLEVPMDAGWDQER
jgi:cell wall-associated NlpC family hydrolase